MSNLKLTCKKLYYGCLFTIECLDENFTAYRLNVSYGEGLDDGAPFENLYKNIRDNVDVGVQFFHEFYSHVINVYMYTGYKYINCNVT